MATLDLRKATTAARRHVPAKAIPSLVRLRARQAMRNPQVLANARNQMSFLLGAAAPEGDIEAAARRYVEWMTWRGEARLHEELVFRPQRLVNAEVLTERDGGIVLSFIHHGQYDGTSASVSRLGVRMHAMVLASSLAPDAPAHIKRHVEVVQEYNETFSTDEGVGGIVQRVEDGHVVLVASDMKGGSRVDFVGRQLRGASGAAVVACRTGRPVVLARAFRDQAGDQFQPYVKFEMLHPQDFAEPRDLLAEILKIHTETVLAWPEAYENPMGYWGVTAEELVGPEVVEAAG